MFSKVDRPRIVCSKKRLFLLNANTNLFIVFLICRVNDRIISVNGVCLENVEYATAVQVLRDSGNTVTLVVKRRVPNLNSIAVPTHSHQHSHSLVSSTGLGGATPSQQTIKLVLSKPNKKDDFGIVLGCRLFVKVTYYFVTIILH